MCNNRISILQYPPITQTENGESLLLEKGVPLSVMLLCPIFVVGVPINFENEFYIDAEKICNVWSYGDLTTELHIHDLSMLQPFPQLLLCRIG